MPYLSVYCCCYQIPDKSNLKIKVDFGPHFQDIVNNLCVCSGWNYGNKDRLLGHIFFNNQEIIGDCVQLSFSF